MYCEYWNLNKAPFDNVPDPSMYADCHVSMKKVISETIFAIKEAHEDFAVIIGSVGSGKTLALRMIIDSLEPDKYKVVIVTNPGIPFTQLLKEIIGQITGKPCAENRKVHLLQTFHRLLFTTTEQGQKIVIFIDEADALSPANLENLRLLTNMQDDQRNLFTLVLAGQISLAQRLEHPKRANLFQRIGVYGRIDKLPSEESVKAYIETRLKLAGTKIKIFPDQSIPHIWEHSEYGVPRLINKICKLCLIAGEINHSDYISSDLVLQISERFQKLSKTAVQKRKPRSRPDDFEISDIVMMDNGVIEALSTEIVSDLKTQHEDATPLLRVSSPLEPDEVSPNDELYEAAYPINESSSGSTIPIIPETAQSEAGDQPLSGTASNGEISNIIDELAASDTDVAITGQDHFQEGKYQQVENENYDEIIIGEHKINLAIPKDILKQVKSFNRESANKSAGFWAAQIIRKNPQLTSSPLADPVYIWNEIKDNILKRIAM